MYKAYVYTYIYTCLKFDTNIVMGLKILCQVGEIEVLFQNILWENVFLINNAKSKVFQINQRPQAFLYKILCQVGKLGS